MATLEETRERSRRVATSIVSFAIMGIGVAFVLFALFLTIRGGLALVFLSILVGGIGIVALLGGFFFHLVPSRLEALAEEKRAYDARQRAEEEEKRKRLRGTN